MVLSSEEAGEMRGGKERRRHGWVRRGGGGGGGGAAGGGGGAVRQRNIVSLSTWLREKTEPDILLTDLSQYVGGQSGPGSAD